MFVTGIVLYGLSWTHTFRLDGNPSRVEVEAHSTHLYWRCYWHGPIQCVDLTSVEGVFTYEPISRFWSRARHGWTVIMSSRIQYLLCHRLVW